MDVCVVFVERTVIWNVSDMKDEKDIKQHKKMDQRGKTPDRQKKKFSPEAWMFMLCLL
jgi:hypothetical protein